MISTILLRPHAGARERLLAPGAPVWVTGARREVGWTVTNRPTVAFESGTYYDLSDYHTPHLVLARDGAEVYEGTDRLRRVLAAHVGVLTDTGGVVFHGAHGDGLRDWRSTEWLLHPWSSVDAVQFYGDPRQAWSSERYKTIHVPALATPPWPAEPRHPLYTIWALGQVAQAQGLGTLVLLDADGEEVSDV